MNQTLPASSNSGCLPWVGLIITSFFLLFFSWRMPGLIDEGVLLAIWWLCFNQIRKQVNFFAQFTGKPKQPQSEPKYSKNSFKSSKAQGQIIDVEAEETSETNNN